MTTIRKQADQMLERTRAWSESERRIQLVSAINRYRGGERLTFKGLCHRICHIFEMKRADHMASELFERLYYKRFGWPGEQDLMLALVTNHPRWTEGDVGRWFE